MRALLKVATSDKGNLTVDLCRGTPLTINELVAEVGRIFGKKVALEHEGDAPEYTTFYASPRAMEALFDFRPTTTLEEGMTGFAEFLRGRRGG